MITNHLLNRIVSNETFLCLLNRKYFVCLQPQSFMHTFQICIDFTLVYDNPWLIFKGKLFIHLLIQTNF
ncbi:unnamed protein product [Rotaria magnacalcarata]